MTCVTSCTEKETHVLWEGPGLFHWLGKSPFTHHSQAGSLPRWPQGTFYTDFTKYRIKSAGRKQSGHLGCTQQGHTTAGCRSKDEWENQLALAGL